MTGGPVRVPELRSRSWYRWVTATFVAVLVMMAWVAVTQPENRVWVAVTLPLMGLWVTFLVRRSVTFDPGTGVVTRTVVGVSRELRLVPGTEVALVPNGAGALLLALRPPGARRRTYLLILSMTDYVEASQPPELLRGLADTLERFCGPATRAVVRQLREQADHVAGGGTARTSPLAALLTYGVLRAAKAGGAGGIVGHLD
ncbi:hypothetical protein GC089_17060 [Cellulomonas sp. JZ18]|uniref:hypothetical protein n=1 Tax=Cellulomonas sp. JZ18 TaxID=2654191 RepID=UPI0012D3D8DD|nr:hypothetical protein [Cellulomonas sp. JZ18]QGQ20584.1 hypothetical protein GC089_17060 [Cellulomonas sp. JZ18]